MNTDFIKGCDRSHSHSIDEEERIDEGKAERAG